MGTLSGVAIRNAMALGYIKRANRMEIYGELVDRDVKVIIGVLQFLNPDMAAKLGELQISFEFAEPFQTDKRDEWQSIVTLYSGGLVSLEEAVRRLGLTVDPVAELERIMAEKSEQEPLYFGTEEETE
jgi:hypothetical protein